MTATLQTSELSKPFLKWAGGKRQLLPYINRLLPVSFNRYHEPFIGGGAVFFSLAENLREQRIPPVISDANPHLIDTYLVIRDDVEKLIKCLDRLVKIYKTWVPEAIYYQYRIWFNAIMWSPEWRIEKAALFIILNKTGFNGLYRVNRKGEFNVPFGKYKNPSVFDSEHLKYVSKLLKNTIIYCQDYNKSLMDAESGDFVYIDPPYTPVSETANFTSYTAEGFTMQDQKNLAKQIRILSNRGVKCMISQAATDDIKELYKGFFVTEVMARRNINSNGEKRGTVSEYLFTNY